MPLPNATTTDATDAPKMTLQEFLGRLRDIDDRTWGFDPDGCIASVEDELCPIHEVWLDSEEGRENGLLSDWGAEADRLGLAPRVARAIVSAADGKGAKATRAKLLAACGL